MKLVFSSNAASRPAVSRLFRVLFYSTQTLTSTPYTKKENLFSRISPHDPSVPIVPILDHWIQEGKVVTKSYLQGMIVKLKAFKRFAHALEVSQWMLDRNDFEISPRDVAIKLDLISRVHGIEQAENFFHNIPEQSKVSNIYNGLLICYAHIKLIEKAEHLVQQMRKLGFARSPAAYNALTYLYIQVGQHEKVDTLMEEMKETGVNPNKFTFGNLLNAYAAIGDVDRMEKTLKEMETDPDATIGWYPYATAANGYVKAGLVDKGLEMLKKSEEVIAKKETRDAYNFILTVYARAGRKDELYRIWNLYKSSEKKVYNMAYSRMIASLLKLDDIGGGEKVLEEWESGDTSYDFRIPNLLISAYCKNGLLDKAEMLVNKAVENGKKPCASTWDILVNGYVEANQIHKAVEAMKAAFLVRSAGWKPNRVALAACLVYLEQQGDAEKTEEFVRLLGAPCHISTDHCVNKEAVAGSVHEIDEGEP